MTKKKTYLLKETRTIRKYKTKKEAEAGKERFKAWCPDKSYKVVEI